MPRLDAQRLKSGRKLSMALLLGPGHKEGGVAEQCLRGALVELTVEHQDEQLPEPFSVVLGEGSRELRLDPVDVRSPPAYGGLPGRRTGKGIGPPVLGVAHTFDETVLLEGVCDRGQRCAADTDEPRQAALGLRLPIGECEQGGIGVHVDGTGEDAVELDGHSGGGAPEEMTRQGIEVGQSGPPCGLVHRRLPYYR